MTRAHSDLRPDDFIVAFAGNEQKPFTQEEMTIQTPDGPVPLRMRKMKLVTGDYSIVGAENLIAVERKETSDLINCIGNDRERFDREMQRILAYPSRVVIVEDHFSCLERAQWRSRLTSTQAIASVAGWMEKGVPFIFAGDRRAAALWCARFLYIAARRRFEQLRAFQSSLKLVSGEP